MRVLSDLSLYESEWIEVSEFEEVYHSIHWNKYLDPYDAFYHSWMIVEFRNGRHFSMEIEV